jgi:DNA-binding transcriptional MerR regulator
VKHLSFIRKVQKLGFTLKEIRKIFEKKQSRADAMSAGTRDLTRPRRGELEATGRVEATGRGGGTAAQHGTRAQAMEKDA